MDISSDLLDEISSDAHSSDLSGHSNQSTGSTTSSPRKATFFFDENSSQDSGVGFDRDSRDAKEDLVSNKVTYPIQMMLLLFSQSFSIENCTKWRQRRERNITF